MNEQTTASDVGHFAKYGPDGQILFIGEMPRAMIALQGAGTYTGQADPRTQYIDLVTRQLRTYTADEQRAKDNLPQGWTWKMPERVAIDVRTSAQQLADDLAQVRNDRAQAYPALADFADAMYWASQGDPSKLEAWTAQVTAIKALFPKPGSPPD